MCQRTVIIGERSGEGGQTLTGLTNSECQSDRDIVLSDSDCSACCCPALCSWDIVETIVQHPIQVPNTKYAQCYAPAGHAQLVSQVRPVRPVRSELEQATRLHETAAP